MAIPIKGNLFKTWRESTQGEKNSLMFRRRIIRNADNMVE
jgi:hypothetical protein